MKNESPIKRELSLVTWQEIRNDVLKVNQELAKIIDAINPSDNYKFVKATYLYGDIFVKNGITQLPYNNNLVGFPHVEIDKKIQDELSYSSMPLFLMLDRSNEFFFDTGERIIPINLFNKGDLSGTYEAMDYMMRRKSVLNWNLSAGSRSIFMLPKITNKINLKRLIATYAMPINNPINRLSDHWGLFRNIAQNKNLPAAWQSNVIFFGKKWLDNTKYSKEWEQFKNYLFRIIWNQTTETLNKVKFNTCWESFAGIMYSRRLDSKHYLTDQVKHLLSIAAGNFPAFTVMDESEEAAPTRHLQQAFTEHYELKQYLPTLMHAASPKANSNSTSYLYYSLAMPTILEGSPVKKNNGTIVSDLREIKHIIEVLKNNFKPKNSGEPNKIIKEAKIDYFHYEKDMCNEIRPSSDIALEDKNFTKDKTMFPSLDFCPTSPFFSGCIRIERPPTAGLAA